MTTNFNVKEFSVKGDGKSNETQALQRAIDECSNSGGGTVFFPTGTYRTGTLFLKSNVFLYLDPGAVILGSTNINDYSEEVHPCKYKNEFNKNRCLIYADNLENIGILGFGIIDMQGDKSNFPNYGDPQENRPMLLKFHKCRHIQLKSVQLCNPASWTTAWYYCSDIVVEGITIHSRVNSNGDGLDFDGCTEIRVSNCTFNTSDDSICLQTSSPDYPCKDVVITNCIFKSEWAGMRIGLLTMADIENVSVTNCVFRDIKDSGIKIQACEGGAIKNMMFSNFTMINVPRPAFVTLSRCRAVATVKEDPQFPGVISGINICNWIIDNSKAGIDSCFVLTGSPDAAIDSIRLNNIEFISGGTCSIEDSQNYKLVEFDPNTVGEYWPEFFKLGATVPAYGLYGRHIKNLVMNNTQFSAFQKDARVAVYLDDVCNCNKEDSENGIIIKKNIDQDGEK
jgi:polygalacturonase